MQQGSAYVVSSVTDGFYLTSTILAASAVTAVMVLTLEDSTNNVWFAEMTSFLPSNITNHAVGRHDGLDSALDRIRLTTVGGTNTFDAGAVNIAYF